MSEFKSKDYQDYNNQVDIEIKTELNISGDDAKTIQDAVNTIIETSCKYYGDKKAETAE